MTPGHVQTERLSLFRLTAEQLVSLRAGGSCFDFILEPGWLEDPADLDDAAALGATSPWWLPFLIRLRGEGRVIGVCLHKGPPDEHGRVEIAYAIAPTWRCQGYAREAVAALSQSTLQPPEVKAVLAHTHPDWNASSRVLDHCGFQRVGVVEDLDLGSVWRWEKSRLSPDAAE